MHMSTAFSYSVGIVRSVMRQSHQAVEEPVYLLFFVQILELPYTYHEV
jgi:hypothetical protein